MLKLSIIFCNKYYFVDWIILCAFVPLTFLTARMYLNIICTNNKMVQMRCQCFNICYQIYVSHQIFCAIIQSHISGQSMVYLHRLLNYVTTSVVACSTIHNFLTTVCVQWHLHICSHDKQWNKICSTIIKVNPGKMTIKIIILGFFYIFFQHDAVN